MAAIQSFLKAPDSPFEPEVLGGPECLALPAPLTPNLLYLAPRNNSEATQVSMISLVYECRFHMQINLDLT